MLVAKQAAFEQLLGLDQQHLNWVSAKASEVHLPEVQQKLAAAAVDRVVQSMKGRLKLLAGLGVAAQQGYQLMERTAEAWQEKLPLSPLVEGKAAAKAVC